MKNSEKHNREPQEQRKHISSRMSDKAIKDALIDNLYYNLAKDFLK